MQRAEASTHYSVTGRTHAHDEADEGNDAIRETAREQFARNAQQHSVRSNCQRQNGTGEQDQFKYHDSQGKAFRIVESVRRPDSFEQSAMPQDTVGDARQQEPYQKGRSQTFREM